MPEEFDALRYMREKNEADAAARAGKIPEKPAEVKISEAKGAEDKKDDIAEHYEGGKMPRSVRREINRLREEAAEARGRLKAIEEFGLAKPPSDKIEEKKNEEDPEPKREGYATDAEYNRALGRWDARQEAKKELGKRDQSANQEKELAELREHFEAMEKKAGEDRKLIPDWDEVAKKAAESEDAVEFTPAEHPTLMGLLASSDLKAMMLYHFAKEPEALQKLLELTKDPQAQIRSFARLEGRVENMYDFKKSEEEAKPTAAERDAKKAKPSESVAARGGQPTDGVPSMTLADGKTLNPAWKANRNAMAGLRP